MRSHIRGVLFATLALAWGMSYAQDVGRVLLAAGNVTAVRAGATIKLTPGAAVQDKDVLRTGATSNLQVRFSDDSMVSLRENSELRIEEFRFSGKEDGTERAFFNLVKGGLRAFTGVVGRGNNNNYRMSTSTATIGIRGTDYVATLCEQGSCRNDDGSAAKDGLYGRVLGASHGTNRVNLKNDVDERQFGINENFYVTDSKSAIQPLLAPPNFLSGKLESRVLGGSAAAAGGAGGSGSEQNAANGTQQDSRITNPPGLSSGLTFVAPEAGAASGVAGYSPVLTPVAVPGPTIGLVGAYSSSSFPFNGEGGGAFVSSSALLLNGSGDLIGLNIPAGTLTTDGISLGITGSSGAAPVDTGVGLAVNAHWGRWPSGTVIDDGGALVSTIPGGAHFLYGDLAPPDVVAAKTGTFTLSQVGGTTPTDSLGGTMSSGGYPSITLNFTTRTGVVNPFNMSFTSGVNFNFSGSGSGTIVIVAGQGAAFIASGSQPTFGCTGGPCISGVSATYNANGIFLGAQGNHLGVSLSMQATGGQVSAQGVRLYTCAPSC
jgi:FecR protein